MTMRDRVRRWLGTDTALPEWKFCEWTQRINDQLVGFDQASRDRHSGVMSILGAMIEGNKERHAEILESISSVHKQIVSEFEGINTCAEDRHGEIIELLTKLEQHFASQHVGKRPAGMPVLDWEQVQIHELAEMLANPPKDEN